MRYVAELAYKGTAYQGWQIQPNTPRTIQQVVQDRLSVLLQQPVTVMAAGRTDAGVHAAQNFIHFDLDAPLPHDALRRINFLLPQDIAIYGFFTVAADFHVRFDATARTYHYFISYRKNPLLSELVCYYPYPPLDVERLNEAAALFLQHSDFAAFSKKRTQVRTSRCSLKEAVWFWNDSEQLLTFRVTADRFLRGMVRGLVATSLRYARGKLSSDNLIRLLQSRRPERTDFSAPAQGLMLTQVQYSKPMQPLTAHPAIARRALLTMPHHEVFPF
ncbi:MAG: tRNA pseudouridine(38-40) synthase TruA [Chitinophagales bacterium]|nr:tRNA pseudouridine(38-40) synthase TruA [Chitinophagales bacterium]MDW8394164.1 tRNA pseudouridine(38-40) synthase TruA [Chitinophagales bacterium]